MSNSKYNPTNNSYIHYPCIQKRTTRNAPMKQSYGAPFCSVFWNGENNCQDKWLSGWIKRDQSFKVSFNLRFVNNRKQPSISKQKNIYFEIVAIIVLYSRDCSCGKKRMMILIEKFHQKLCEIIYNELIIRFVDISFCFVFKIKKFLRDPKFYKKFIKKSIS